MNCVRNQNSNVLYRSDIAKPKEDLLQTDFDPPKKEFLPDDFVPGESDVIVGRGKKYGKHDGNKNLCRIIKSNLEEYSASTCKSKKSNILSSITSQIRTNGRFVKVDIRTGRWYDVGDKLAREKISQAFRDELHEKYKSSVLSKKHRRIEKRAYHYSQTQNQVIQYHMERIRQLCDQRIHSLNSQEINIFDDEPAINLSNFVEEISAKKLLSDNENRLQPEPISRTYQGTDDPFEPTPLSEDGLCALKAYTACNGNETNFPELINLEHKSYHYSFENLPLF